MTELDCVKSHVQNIILREDRSYPTIEYIQPAVEPGFNCYYVGFNVIIQAFNHELPGTGNRLCLVRMVRM